MKHKTWFRLVLKAIGVLLIAWGLPNLVGDIVSYVVWRVQQVTAGMAYAGIEPEWLAILLHLLESVIKVAIGLYLLLDGKWLLDKIIPSNRPYCPDCGYDLSESGNPAACSECGTKLQNFPGSAESP